MTKPCQNAYESQRLVCYLPKSGADFIVVADGGSCSVEVGLELVGLGTVVVLATSCVVAVEDIRFIVPGAAWRKEDAYLNQIFLVSITRPDKITIDFFYACPAGISITCSPR